MELDIIYIDGIAPLNTGTSYIGYLFSVSSFLDQHKYQYKILNLGTLQEYSLDCLIEELKYYKFKSIGMTTNATNIKYVYKICNSIKEKFPNVAIILGGPEVSYSDIETLQNCKCDIIIRKEGEYKTVMILDYITKKRNNLKDIPGISYKDAQGKIYVNEDSLDYDINALPRPNYDILADKKYWIIPHNCEEEYFDHILPQITTPKNSYILTGIGCPYRCSFCVEGITLHKRTHYILPEKVKENLEFYLKTTKAQYIGIADDTFTSSTKRVKDICEVFSSLREKYKFVWFAEGRVDIISKNLELIRIMYNAGLRRLQIGIESGNQKVLDVYNKLITVEEIVKVLEEVAKYPDLEVVGNVIVGNPFETIEEFKRGVQNLKKMFFASGCKLRITSSFLTPYHGTPIRNNPEKFGIDFIVNDFEFSEIPCMDGISCKPKHLSIKEVAELKLYVEKSIALWQNETMFNLSKSEIDSRIMNEITIDNPFKKTFGELFTFQRYSRQIRNKNTIPSSEITDFYSDDIFPTRLWIIEKTNMKYEYFTINGEKIEMENYETDLWELANGNNSIKVIYQQIKDDWSIKFDQIIQFYVSLEQSLGIVFKKYDCKQ